jgi:diguanylate cyclase (GGDEF)-like protein
MAQVLGVRPFTLLDAYVPARLDRLLLVLLLGVVLAHLGFTLLPHRPDLFREWAGNLFFFPAFFLSASLAIRAAVRHPVHRTPWLWFAWGQIAWGIGQVIYIQLSLVQHVSPYPSLADAFYLMLIPCFIIGLLRLQPFSVSLQHGAIVTLDTLIVVFALASVYWEIVIAQSVQHNSGSVFALLVSLAYPGLDLLLTALLIVWCVWKPREFAGPTTLALTLGLVWLLLAHLGYQLKTEAGTYQIGYPLDTLWLLAAAFFGVAATLASESIAQRRIQWEPLTRLWIRNAGFSQLALPYLALVLVLGLATKHHLRPHSEAHGVLLVVFAVVALSSLRQFLTQYEARRLQQNLDQLVRQDVLTGLANRSSLLQLLDQALTQTLPQQQVAVLFIDLDRFKFINDTYGHASGDALLREVADRMRSRVSLHDIVARQGGDEFVVVLTRVEQTMLIRERAVQLLEALSQPFLVAGTPICISASIGIMLCLGDTCTAADALQKADLAMYEAKRRGRNTLQFYDQHIQQQTTQVHQIELHLRRALERRELSLVYQPLVTLASNTIQSAEALLRWHSPVLGGVSPMTFIPIAEQRGLIVPIGDWVLETALEQLSQWRAERAPTLQVSVNVSPQQFDQDDFVEKVEAKLVRWSLPGEALMLELTEGTLLVDLEASNTKLAQLRRLGVQVALDDFGTGYSSLAYLRSLQVDVVKIDRSFIWAMQQEGPTFVQAIVQIAHHIGLRIVAEGIETVEQRKGVQALSCDVGQGYWFARPLSPQQFSALLHEAKWDPGNRTGGQH